MKKLLLSLAAVTFLVSTSSYAATITLDKSVPALAKDTFNLNYDITTGPDSMHTQEEHYKCNRVIVMI